MKNPVWLFDLDNTLHDATPHIFPHINRAMRQYIERHLAVDTDEANRIRQDYWRRYGATLLGLMRHALRRLAGRKIVFSNGPRHYAEAVLDITGLRHEFDALYAVEDVRFQPKPSLAGFRRLLSAERLDPRRCIMVEDSLENLISAKRLGMKTVWVSTGLRQSPFVDVKISSVTQLPQRCAQL